MKKMLIDLKNNFNILPCLVGKNLVRPNVFYEGFPNHNKTLYIFLGPSGSGKTTIIANLIQLGYFKNIPYINRYLYNEDIPAEEVWKLKSLSYELNEKLYLAKHNVGYICETTYISDMNYSFYKQIKEMGYKIVGITIKTSGLEENLFRVNHRVNEGGHNVSFFDIEKECSKIYVVPQIFIDLCDDFVVIINSQKYDSLQISIKKLNGKSKEIKI